MRVPNTFFEIRDFSSLKLGNRALKAKLGRDSGLNLCVGGGMPKKLSVLRDWSTFWVGITGWRTLLRTSFVHFVKPLLYLGITTGF